MFSITGLIDGVEYTLKYENGVLTGDPVAIQKAREENKKIHGALGMPPCTTENYLDLEIPAQMLISGYVFEKIVSHYNDHKSIPEGCVI